MSWDEHVKDLWSSNKTSDHHLEMVCSSQGSRNMRVRRFGILSIKVLSEVLCTDNKKDIIKGKTSLGIASKCRIQMNSSLHGDNEKRYLRMRLEASIYIACRI